MSSLNLSANGPSITKSYQSVVNAPAPAGVAASSPTYGTWVVYTVAAPLANAFQQDSGKESVMKVKTTGEGELADFIEEFSDGRIQFGFLRVKDPNTSLPKNVLVGWCGEGVPERTKGYFTNHLQAVSKLLQGYHVQITARSDRDLTPESILQKVADASGSKYSGATSAPAPAPPVASKPAFLPTKVGGGGAGFTPLGARGGVRVLPQGSSGPVDDEGWGQDAPDVSRSQLQKVASAYQPTKVNMAELTSQKQESRFAPQEPSRDPNIIGGGYQPVGKVDIAEIRRKAQASGQMKDDRPTPVSGAYQPIGKVDIAAIRARSQPQPAAAPAETEDGADDEAAPLLAERSAAFQQSERMTSMPKPKVANKFGGSGSFAGTRAPVPVGFSPKPNTSAAPVGVASRTFADEGGKTPAQIWAEKKARAGGALAPAPGPPIGLQSQPSGGDGGWKSGYTGKSWATVQTTRTGQSSTDEPPVNAGRDEEAEAPTQGIGSIRDRFAAAPPPMDIGSKPNAGARAMPPRPEPEEEEEEEERPRSPIRVAMPVGRRAEPEPEPETELEPAPQYLPPAATVPAEAGAGIKAVVQYDYEKAEDNEIELKEGDIVTHIEMVDADWWMGRNVAGETGLFPSNYVEVVEEDEGAAPAPPPYTPAPTSAPTHAAAAPPPAAASQTAIAEFEYEAAEDNELSFPEGAKITNVEFPDEDWWHGEYQGKSGLFPANYVKLDE